MAAANQINRNETEVTRLTQKNTLSCVAAMFNISVITIVFSIYRSYISTFELFIYQRLNIAMYR